MNKAIIIGNLTKDPELRVTGNSISVCSFTVAVSRKYKDQNGERQTDFIPVVTWRGLADNCGKYLAKGRKVGVTGVIQTRSYDAQDGTKRYVTEIVAEDVEFLTPAGQGTGAPPMAGADMAQMPPPMGNDMDSFTAIDDDELPF